jgi:cytochrome P450
VVFDVGRVLTAPVELGGYRLPAGVMVVPGIGLVHASSAQYDNPDRFDPTRENNEHFGFGSGIHTCFGGPLARLEVNLALEVFLSRVRSPKLVVDPPPYRHNQVFRGPRHVWVDFAAID